MLCVLMPGGPADHPFSVNNESFILETGGWQFENKKVPHHHHLDHEAIGLGSSCQFLKQGLVMWLRLVWDLSSFYFSL